MHDAPTNAPPRRQPSLSVHKLPQITAMFWALKIAATTLGETGGDQVAQTMHVGYLTAFFIFIGVFLVSVTAQLRAKRFHPALYWTVIVATSTAGTTMSDYMDRTLALGYAQGSLVLILLLITIFCIWGSLRETFRVDNIKTLRGETLYWSAILVSNTLGTALGDFLSDNSGLHFWGSFALIAAVMLVILAAHYRTRISTTLLFWLAFVLTRPLGASAGDLLWKPHAKGGLGWGTANVSYVLLAVIVVLTTISILQQRRATTGPDRLAPPAASVATQEPASLPAQVPAEIVRHYRDAELVLAAGVPHHAAVSLGHSLRGAAAHFYDVPEDLPAAVHTLVEGGHLDPSFAEHAHRLQRIDDVAGTPTAHHHIDEDYARWAQRYTAAALHHLYLPRTAVVPDTTPRAKHADGRGEGLAARPQ